MKGYVYQLESLRDGVKYIGSTTNNQQRINYHISGRVKSTKSHRPYKLTVLLEYDSIAVASIKEKQIKRSHDSLIKEIKKTGCSSSVECSVRDRVAAGSIPVTPTS